MIRKNETSQYHMCCTLHSIRYKEYVKYRVCISRKNAYSVYIVSMYIFDICLIETIRSHKGQDARDTHAVFKKYIYISEFNYFLILTFLIKKHN